MRENASRFYDPACRTTAARFVISTCCVFFAFAAAAIAATDFSDYSLFGSASSNQVSSIKIGATTDTESVITANTTATGDDTTGSDDEDGVTVPASIVAGTSGSLTVNVTNSSGATVFLNAWIDFNRNGVLTDSGEQIAINTTVATGTSNNNRTISFTVPAAASIGTAGVRVRLTSTSSPGSTGLSGNGEVEDYVTTIACPTITVTGGALADGVVGRPYSQTLAGSGGNGSYTWTLSSGTLPAGLSLTASTGVISGTPTAATSGTTSLTFTATDASGCQGSATRTLQVFNYRSITPTTLPPPTVGTAYSQTVSATEAGFDVQQAFSSTSVGTLAAADAVLAGTNRTSNWTGSASYISYSSSGSTGGHFTDTDFPAGPGDNFALKATGIITIPTAGAWTFATNSDDGARVKIDGTAVINDDTQHAATDKFGTVTLTAGTHVIELVFFDSGGGEAIELFAAQGTLSSFSSSFKLIGASDGLSVVRSSPTYTWSVTSGSLPAGLSLNTSTGLISGTPTSASTATFTLRATDNSGYSVTQNYTVTTCSAISLSPTTLPASMVNSAYSQTLTATGGTQPYSFALTTGSLPSGLALSTDTGVISGRPTSTTAATFTIAATDAIGCSSSRSYTLTPASPTDFGDYSGVPSASSTVLSTLKIGALTDAEPSATTDLTATGDDLTDLPDEDGVTVPAYLIQGLSSSITVNITNTTGASAYLNAWIDYNKNGVFTDSGEQIAANTVIATGTSNSNRTVTFTVPATAVAGNTAVRVRLTSTSSPGSTGASGNGEVEDDLVTILPPTDFGDDSGFSIAGSTTSTALRMGALVDSEGSGLANSAATGDDTNGSDDEDGVTLPASVIQGQSGVSVTVNVTNTTGADAFLNGWIDFNNNGILTDAGEQIVVNDVVSTGTSGATRSYTFTVPSAAATGAIGVRFRLTSIASPGDSGVSGTGEVEDYALTVYPPSDHGDFSRFADASSFNIPALGIGDLEDSEITAVTNLAATGDDITNINDEDGVTLQAILVQGQAGVAVTVKLNNTSGAPSYLNGWVDFNNDGTLDASEQVIADSVVDDGTSGSFQTFYFDVPSTATVGTVGARFRLTSAASPGPTGASSYGEVEDYTTSIVAPSSNFRDYFYTIRAVGTQFYLDEISVYNPNSATPTVSVTQGILNLNTASPGFNASATDAWMNGLALDWLNRRFYWMATSTGSSGYNASLYTAAYNNVTKTWSYQLVTGSTLSNITFNTGTPASGSASSGAFPRAAFYNGEYYAGGQLSNNVAVWHLNSTGLGLNSPSIGDYKNFFHLSQTFNGGDFVIRPQDGLLVTSTVINNANTLFTQFIDDGINSSGPAATTASVDSQIPYSSNSSVQIAGVGGVSRLYALGSTGTNIYRLDNYDTSTPKAVKVGPLPTASYTDLSEGISSSVTSLGVKGIVYYDTNGLSDGIINGTGTNASGTLFAMLVDSAGKLVDSFPVKSDGTFILGGATANTTYKVVLSTSYGSLGSTAPAAALPTGWLNAGEFLGSGAGSDGTIDGSLTVSVGSVGVVNATFGLSQTLSIGDTVWNDINNNGVQDTGESGIGSVTVQLWNPGTDNAIGGTGSAADTLAATTTTDGTGAYIFVGLTAGKYFVTVTPTSLYSVVSSTAAGDNGVDGDNNGSQPGGRGTTVYSPIITLTQAAEPGNLATGGGNIEDTIDFGLLTAVDYGDYAPFGSAGSALVSTLYLGTLIDSEYSPLSNSSANGDDLNGLADEDGMTVPASIYVGTSGTLSITTTNTSGASAFLNVWIDFNRNGVLTDSGEQVASNVIISNGANKVSRNVNFTVPGTASLGTTGVRVRLTSVSTPGSIGTSGNGEVEDYVTTIACPVVTVAAPPAGTVSGAYSQTLSASGGTAPYTWALVSGTLPAGLAFDSSTATISGTPTASNGAGTTLSFRTTDANGCQATTSVRVQVCPVVSISTSTLPAAIQGAPYSQTLASSSGASPYSYTLASGSLPAGLSLSTAGIISGTPTTLGTVNFTIQSTDANGCSGTRTLSITTNPPVTDFGDYPGFPAASQTASSEIRIGTNATDVEPVNPTTGTANIDDTTGTDDEDLVIPSVVSGGDLTVNIPVTLSGSTTLGRVGVWADWNGDGDTLDANETVTLVGSGVIGGSNIVTATFSPPAGTTTGTKYLRIIAVEGTAAPSFSGASSLKGEVEDYAITVTAPTMDYGDLPDPVIGTSASNYQTLTNDNGPAHIASTTLRLGATVDAEGNGQPNNTATGDGADEDGVATLPTLTQNLPATLTINATNSFGSAGFLKAWIDWNNDGNLTADEELGSEINVPNGTNNGAFSFNFTVPSTAVIGTSLGLRVRLASQTIPASNGVVGTGEVEDYLVTVNASTVDFGDYPGFPSASRVASTQIKIGTNSTDVETSNPASGNATADDTTGTDDEDLTMPTLQAGTSGTLSIPVTLTSPVTAGKIAVWADWNGDNLVTGTNETVSLSSSSLVSGSNTITATLSPPLGTTGGTKFLRIIVNEGSTVPAFSGSSTLQGEVEDYAITVNAYTLDYGDLPDTGAGTSTGNYQTLSSDSGPSHTVTSTTLRLGATVDTEADGQPNATATGDGADEDSITSMPVFYRGQSYTIPVSVFNNTGGTARIFAFIDWNNDGDFADAGESLTAVAVSSSASQQTVNITGTTPGTAALGTFGARFRLATATTLTSTGTTSNGEVEDYIVTGACPTLSITPTTLPATTQYASYNQTLSVTNGTSPYTWTLSTGALPAGLALSSGGVLSGTVTSASGAYVFTARATDANGCSATQSYTISVGSGGMSVGNLVFLDENNNGLKDAGERGIPNVPVEIWSAGADGKVNSADDQPVLNGCASVLSSGGMLTAGTFGTIASGYSTLTARTDWTGAYQFTQLPTGVFYLKITPPRKSVFSSKFDTGTTTYSLNLDFPLASSSSVLIDNGIDNDSNGVQTTGSFTGSSDAVVAGVGAAVYSMPFTLATSTEPGTSNLGSDEYTIDFGLRPCPAIGVSPLTVPAVSSGVAYSTTLSASGGAAPYTYAITQGTLPSGLSMSTGGVISGTTSTTGTSAITVCATDARGCQGFTTIQLSVTTAMSITTASLPNGTEGTAYTTTTLTATGGSSPYQNWRVSTGVLPAGMSLNSSTGVLSGTPASPGTYVVTIAVDDALVTPATVSVTNGSVETDAWSAITFTPRTSVTGWTLGNSALSGTATAVQLYGINDNNASNSPLGQTPAGSQYLASPFVDSWASQTVSGFTVGRPYTLRVRYAMRGSFANPATTEAQPPFYGNALWIAGYNASAASLFGPASVNFPAPTAANYDNWATLDVPFVPQTSSMVFSYGLDGMAIDDVQFIPTVAATATATKQFAFVIAGNRDWGDLPDTGIGTGTGNYQTTNNDSGPSHYRNSNLRLGATLDIESDGQPDATATGDDLSGTDDEDAITTLPAFARGQTFTIPVSVFNNTGTNANVFAFIDWNNDGDFLDPSEALASSSVPSGSSQQSVNVSGNVPGNAVLAQTGLRVRLSTAGALGAFGLAANGEVEDYLITTTCPTVSLTPASLPGGTLGSTYSQTLTATGGTGPYTYALNSGTLPSGVTLNATTGILSGTPNVAGTFNFTLSATDANGCAGSKTYSVVMSCPTLSITPAALTAGTVGTAYSQTLTASGGASPYGSWTVTSGTLPAGLTLNASTGVISGTPTTGNGAGVSFTVRTTDANGCQGSQAVTLKICPVITVSPTTLTAATVNSPYSQTLTASGGASAYTYAVSSGTLPAGLSLSSAGILSGTPTSTASSTFTITATDANGCQGSRAYTLAPSCPLISVSPAAPARATVGTAYSQTMSASGGLAPYGSWAVTSGTLPAGLSLNASTGVISGTPTTSNGAGASVTIRATDANGCTGSQAVTLQICPVLTLTPASLPNGTINTSYSQTITTSGGASPYTYTLGSGSLPAGLTLSSGGVLSGTPTSTTAATFSITATDANGCTASASYTVTPAPDADYGDYSLFANASSRMNSTLRLGALTDVEASATTNTAATGDDITGSDDEDGVTLPANITQGGASSITVNVTNTSGATVFLNAWIDFNQNGSLSDAGEQIATNTLIVTGTSNANRTVSFTAPANAVLGTAGVRVRLTSTSSPGPTGASGNGEVEDNVVSIVAPTTDYGDFSLFADAYSTGSANLKLGPLQDLEGSSTKDSSAQGDDNTGIDDEDSVTFPSMTAGQPMSLPVTVTNLTGSTAYLNAWIDFNNNGVLTDAGEQIATNVNIITGTSGGTTTLNFTVPTNAVTAAALIGARFRLTNVQTPGSTGGVGIGEVEDHTVVILAPLTDFGDFSGAPNVSNTASTNLRLGALVDTEYAATTDATATGDDLTGVDDEDGVTLPSMTAGAPATVSVVATNNTGSPAYLNAWIDYNNNGVFTDSGEQIATNTAVANGATNSTFNINTTVPAAALTGTSLGVRVRISNDISPGSTGSGGVGEVEDYVVSIAQPTTDFGDYSLFSVISGTTNSRLRLGALTDTEYNATTNATATGDDTTGVDDEDGVTLPSMIAGAPATIPIVVTNTTGSSAYLNAWIDYNGNGSIADAGEQIATNTVITTGTSNSTFNLNTTIPATTLTGVPLGVRVMLTSTSSPASSGNVGTGEIEDYVVSITAPTTDFGDFSSFADASQGVSPSLRMGSSVDAEYTSTRNSTATGDDITGIDDEDGVTLPSMTAGQTLSIPVVASNSSGAMGYLNAWIDFDNNGTLAAGEQIATNLNIPDGSSDATFNITFTVPLAAVTGTNVGARFRLSAPTSPGPTGANAAIGEIEDYVVNIAAPTLDFGDYSGIGNAASTANNKLRIGALIDAEYAANNNTTATGDDTTGSDDEDGVTIPTLTAGSSATIPVVVSNSTGSSAYLNAWIDFNNNGLLTDSGEQIATNSAIATGTSNATRNLTFTVPLNAASGTPVGVRVRLTAVSSPGPTGTSSGSGEVEDYVVNIVGPTTDYGDWSGVADASNTVVSSLRLGALTDAEFTSTKNATATGDDTTNLADEDGVALPAMTAGGTYQVPVTVTNTSGATAYLNAWIDFNNNGSFADTGEQVANNVSVTNGQTNATINQSVSVPAAAVTGTNLGVRFRLTSTSTPGATGTGGGNGEVEDYVVNIAVPTTDFGDFNGFAGASSTADTKLRMGALVDTEFSATTDSTATGDDLTGSDDEDGVTLPSLTAGAPATIPVIVTNTSGTAANLNAWIDFNNNGVLTDAGEQIATNVSIASGLTSSTQNLNITVPAGAVTGTTLGVRFRLTSVSSPGATGAAGTGEVEDYVVSIISPPLDYGDWSGISDAASTASSTLRLGALVDTEYVSTLNASATGDDITGSDDEDGVTLPSLTAGAPATIPIIVTNTSGSTAYLNVWIDYNNNGVLSDAGEQIATDVSIPTGLTSSTQNLNITVPAGAVTGSNLGVRVRLTSVSSPGITGTAGSGEVEDYVTSIAVPTTDFGDWNGAADASSLASSNLRMGALADTEYVSTLNASATGDDITGSDDEDGVTLPSQTPGTAGSATVVVTNNSGAAGYLNAWIDFNNNGSFADSGEQIATNTLIATGTNGAAQTVNFVVPVGAVPGQRGARFRLTSTQSPTSVGASGVGEVEDYLVTITCLPIAVSPTTLNTPTVGTAFSQTVTASGGMAPYTYSVGSGTLPAGLTLSSAGVLSGTPTSSSATTFSITATDSYGCTGTRSYSVTPVCPTITVNPSTLPSGSVGTAYSQTLTASGGTAAYTYAVSSGTLPAGLSLNSTTGVISGTPTTSNGSGVSLTFRATDANGCTGTRTINLIICPVITLTPATLPAPVVGTAYSQTLAGSGGATPYTFAVASGTLPTWATLSSSGVLSGTPTSTTAATFTVRATDANGCSGTLSYTVTPVCPTITLTPSALAQGTVGTAYSQTLSATGGTAPYSSWTVTSGALPAGLSLNSSTGVISGTPTATASPATTITVRVNDAYGCQGTRSITLQVCPAITLSPATLTTPVIGVAYSQSLSASSGTSPYSFALASGSLPAWASLSTAGVITGTPTSGTSATFSVRATDANGCSATASYTLAPNCPAISIAPVTASQATVGSTYTQTLTATGGTAPYSTWTVTNGTLPAGLSLNTSTGVISGTPTTANGTGVSVSIRATDANGCQGTQVITFQVCPVITLAPTTPATPTVSTAYSQTFTASGGAGSYTYTVASGTLPTWATLSSGGVLSGTPDSPNSATFTVKATDANGCSGTQSCTITPVCPAMAISPTTAATGIVGSIYSQALTGSGGTAPYGAWTVTNGTLPAGLTLNASTGVISGTPTASTGAATSVTVRTTDARGCQVSAVISIKVCPVVNLSPTTLAASTAGTGYSQTISGSGGVAPYTFTVSSGTLPTGLTLSSAGALTGTPTSTASTTFTVTATDANGCTGTRSYTMVPACPAITVSPSTLANGTVNTAYSQTITSSGGIGAITYTVSSGTLPAGLSLNATSGVISGTPTSTAAATFTVRATDSNGCTGSTSYTVTPACPVITVTPATLTTGTVGVAYSQTLSGAGGIAPYASWTVTSGTLPAGLSLNSSSGVISGTPTTSNGTGVNVTIRTTDANGCQGSSVLSIKICPVITLSPSTLTAPVVGTAYSQSITPAGGVSPYTFTLASGSLPSGLALSSNGIISGTTTSVTPASFTVRATAADGCSGTTAYTVTPVCPTLTLSPSNAALPVAYLGASYTQALTASGGTAPYTFALVSGDLPGGVLLSSSGTLSGTPTAKGSFPITIRVTDANSCAQSFNLTLQVRTLSIGNLVFEDSNNNGLKDTGEPGVAGATVQLFSTGDDNAIGGSGTAADTQVGSDLTTDSTGAYLFGFLPAGNYYIKVIPPVDYLFTGGTPATTDNNVDNNNDGSQPGGSGTPLFSPVINLSGGAESTTDGDGDADTNLTVDFGLWSSVAVGNFIFLDINGDGRRNEGESLGNIYVELYAQGATPGVDDPVTVGTSGCSCKGRYYLDGLNPGTYFLHIPASQFTTGSPLEGLLPMSSVVPGDDDVGQDLIYNSNPAVNGASTGLFTLRPGFCPVGAAESGAEGSTDDAMDARVDLTRDLGIVAPAGTGFAASTAIRRYIVTGGFTASVLPGATTFATWSQDSSIGSATADPDEDGVANLMEYALGTDPASPLQPGRFTLTQDTTGSLVALLTVPSATHDDLIISLETLTDLSKAASATAWKKLSMAAATTINTDGTLTRSYSNLQNLLVFKGLDAGYIRLRVDLDANRDGVPEATVSSTIQGWSRQTFAPGSRTFSMPLLNASFFTGRTVSVSANEVMLPAIVTLPAGSFYLEALEGPLAGQRFDIDAATSSGNTIVLQNTSQSYAGLANARISIRQHHTLGGLLPSAAFSSEDRVLFFDPAASNFTTLTNSNGYWLSDVLSMNARPFAAHEAAMVQVRGAGNVLMFTGEVRLTNYVTPLVAGTQLIAPGWPVTTPAPVDGLSSGLTPDGADRFRLWDGDTTPDASSYTGYYLDGTTTPPAWLPQTTPAPAANVQPFHGFFLIRTAPLQLNQAAPW